MFIFQEPFGWTAIADGAVPDHAEMQHSGAGRTAEYRCVKKSLILPNVS